MRPALAPLLLLAALLPATAQDEVTEPGEAASLKPKYGIPGYETKWQRTPEKARRVAKDVSGDTDQKGWEALHRGDTDTAMKRFNQAWTLWDENPLPLWGMGLTVFERTRASDATDIDAVLAGFDQSVALIEEARTLTDEQAPMLTDLALVYANRGGFRAHAGRPGAEDDYSAAGATLDKAEEINGGPHSQIELTREALERYRGNAEKADAHAATARQLRLAAAPEREEDKAKENAE